ncbi:MAG: UDP-N-acetylmuramate dehydrogenase [Bacteroidota bacterium]|nr:UDP-N-acetylmuramate dehydrogenase [Bacteroidota bacterium]
MQIEQNISLKPFNTFGIDVVAKHFVRFTSLQDLYDLLEIKQFKKDESLLTIGGGSNILLTRNYNGLVAKNEMLGTEVIHKDEQHVYVRVAAGENWHQFVLYCINNNFAGVENLSLIPGNVGASPMQNIGAYGVEIKDVFHELEAVNINEKRLEIFTADQCEFGYRESIFKRKYKGLFIITSVTFRLKKKPDFNVGYGAIQQELERLNIKELSIVAISQAVINIRRSKLPDPDEIGNAGSFFKNPAIPQQQFEELKKTFPQIVGYAAGGNEIKVAAGWLIEQCGWKGYRKGDAGCYAKQALVLVNYGRAKGSELFELSTEIIKSVETKFGIKLEREVNIL